MNDHTAFHDGARTSDPPPGHDDPHTYRPPPPQADHTSLIRAVAVVAILVGVTYLTWRAMYTINPDAPVLSWSLWAFETYAVLGLTLFTFSLWDSRQPLTPGSELPEGKVAVLITTYNETLEVILPAVVGALRIDTPHETWVLDDGARPEVERLSERLGANYLARHDGRDAKAGNLNNALRIIDADFVATFDADHVPRPDFLRRTLPYLADPRIALVQTPQDFYNEDSFEHITGRGDKRGKNVLATEQSLFYRVIQPAKNRWESAFWCGTGAVLRTSALAAVGGVATGSITEDFQTTIRLHRAGWESVYHNEVLARGLAAPTAEEYLLQRRRWCIGAMQTWRQEAPLTERALTIGQRISYAATMLAWFDPLRTFGLLLLPPIVLLTGTAPIIAPPMLFIAVFAVAFTLQQLALFLLGRGQHRPVSNTVFELVRMETIFSALVEAFTSRKVRFHVTPKGQTAGHVRRVGVPHLLVALSSLYLVSFGPYVASLSGVAGMSYPHPGVAHGAAFWAVIGGLLLLMAIRRIRSVRFSPERRRSYRHPVIIPADVEGKRATVTDLSLTGVRLEIAQHQLHDLVAAGEVRVDLLLDDGVERLVGTVATAAITQVGSATVGLEIDDEHGPTLAGLAQGLIHRA